MGKNQRLIDHCHTVEIKTPARASRSTVENPCSRDFAHRLPFSPQIYIYIIPFTVNNVEGSVERILPGNVFVTSASILIRLFRQKSLYHTTTENEIE